MEEEEEEDGGPERTQDASAMLLYTLRPHVPPHKSIQAFFFIQLPTASPATVPGL